MKIIGTVTEFNPLHDGHKYFLQQIKQQSGADATVCVMSASFVQRGEPACYDKFLRTRAALAAGADMVLELPAPVSLQGAQYFGLGAMRLLVASGIVDGIAFGCEEATELTEIDEKALHTALDEGTSYAKALQSTLQPNSLLGTEYMRALKALGSNLPVYQIQRSTQYQSAAQLRAALQGTPGFLSREDMLVPLLVKLRGMDEAELAAVSQVGEGLQWRILKQAQSFTGLEKMICAVKSKRYTYSRISRIMCCAMLDITADITDRANKELPYLRVLGVKKDKKELLSFIKSNASLPVVTNVADYMKTAQGFGKQLMQLECRATDIRAALAKQNGAADYTTGIIIG